MAASSSKPGAKVAKSFLTSTGQTFQKGAKPGTIQIVPKGAADLISSGTYLTERSMTTPSGFGNALGSQESYVDFYITGKLAGSAGLASFDTLVLNVDVANGDGANAATVGPSPYMFSKWEVYIDGACVITLTNPRAIEKRLFQQVPKHEMMDSLYALYGYDSGITGAAFSITAATTQTFQIPVHYILPWITQLPLAAISSEVKLRFYFAPKSYYLAAASASTTLSVANVKLLYSGHRMNATGTAAFESISRAATQVIPCRFYTNKNYPIGTLSAGQVSSLQTLNAQGWIVDMWGDLYDTAMPSNFEGWVSSAGVIGFNESTLYDVSSQIINTDFTSSAKLRALYARAVAKAMPTLCIPLTEVSGTPTGAGTLNYMDAGPIFIFCNMLGGKDGVWSDSHRMGSISFLGQESISVAPDANVTTATLNIDYDILARIVKTPDGKLTFIFDSSVPTAH